MSKQYTFQNYLWENAGGSFKWGWFALPLAILPLLDAQDHTRHIGEKTSILEWTLIVLYLIAAEATIYHVLYSSYLRKRSKNKRA